MYKGFKMILSFDTFDRTFHLDLKNKLSYNLALGSDLLGNITRIDNTLGNIKNKKANSIKYTIPFFIFISPMEPHT